MKSDLKWPKTMLDIGQDIPLPYLFGDGAYFVLPRISG